MRTDLGLTPLQLGFIFSAFAYPYAAMQIAGGWTRIGSVRGSCSTVLNLRGRRRRS